MQAVNESECKEDVNVQVSPTFFGWLAQFSGKMKIVKPKRLEKRYREHIENN